MKPHIVLCEELVKEAHPRDGNPPTKRYVTVIVDAFECDIDAVNCMKDQIARYPLNIYYTAKVSRKMQMQPTCVDLTED